MIIMALCQPTAHNIIYLMALWFLPGILSYHRYMDKAEHMAINVIQHSSYIVNLALTEKDTHIYTLLCIYIYMNMYGYIEKVRASCHGYNWHITRGTIELQILISLYWKGNLASIDPSRHQSPDITQRTLFIRLYLVILVSKHIFCWMAF